MKMSARSVVLPLCLVVLALGLGVFLGDHLPFENARKASDASLQQEMDAFCAAKLNDSLSNHAPDEKKTISDQAFFSRKLHTCVWVEVTLEPKDAGAMNYVMSDLTYGFVAPPKWHRTTDFPLHVILTNYGTYHSLYAEGYWAPVSSDPSQQSVADSNAVKITCEFTDGRSADDQSNSCTETEGYTQFGSIHTDTQTFHIASWRSDEVIATDAERGLSGSTTTTLLIRPEANEIEVVDRTRMDEKQPTFTEGMAGKSFGGHYELHGGMYLIDTEGVFFQCDEDGVVTDMRLDVVQKHQGDVVDVPSSEWNAGSKANHKFTQQECDSAMQRKLGQLH